MLSKEQIEYLTRTQTKHLWGQFSESYDCLIESPHGDGKKTVWFQTMNSRPFYYILQVDSKLDLDKEDYEVLSGEYLKEYGTFSEMLMRMIEEQCDNIDSYEEIEGWKFIDPYDKTVEPFEEEWPIFSLGAGYSYGEIDMEYVNKQITTNV